MNVLVFFISIISFLVGLLIAVIYFKQKEKHIRQDAVTRSRAVLKGQFSEQLAPYLPDFPYSPTECKFLGKPIDFLVFKGMDEKDISEVVFLEVKTGKSQLNTQERKLKKAIEDKKISYEVYHA